MMYQFLLTVYVPEQEWKWFPLSQELPFHEQWLSVVHELSSVKPEQSW